MASASASFSFSSTEAGSSFECRLDGDAWAACSSPRALSGLPNGSRTFSVRAKDAAQNVDASPAARTWTVEVAPAPPPLWGPLGNPACVSGATTVTTADAVRSEVAAGRNVCLTAAVATVNLAGLTSAQSRHVGTSAAGGMGKLELAGSSNLVVSARFRYTELHGGASSITLRSCRIGGESTGARVDEHALVRILGDARNITIEDCVLGWTTAGSEEGDAIEILQTGDTRDITIRRNQIIGVANDAIQVGGRPPNVLIDRNEISYIAPQPDGPDTHGDSIQLVDYGNPTVITNNWLHHNGYPFPGAPNAGAAAGPIYAHGGNAGLRFENNLVVDNRNSPDFGNLGTGGCSFQNAVARRNTFVRNGLAFGSGFYDFNWQVCGGASNVLERNAGGSILTSSSSGTTIRENATGLNESTDFDVQGNCTAAACNPAGQEAIGYRKPSGVHW